MAETKTPEADLCREFSAHAENLGWEVHPEVSGWDLLLQATDAVRCSGIAPGDQIGVQAKVRPNLEVIAQTLRYSSYVSGPHYRAILVPELVKASRYTFPPIAHELRCLLFHKNKWKGWANVLLEVPIHYRLHFDSTCWVPPYDNVQGGGHASPTTVSDWKIRAVTFCIQYQSKTFTAADLRYRNLAYSTFKSAGWLKEVGKAGRARLYKLDPDAKTPDKKYVWLADQIRARKAV